MVSINLVHLEFTDVIGYWRAVSRNGDVAGTKQLHTVFYKVLQRLAILFLIIK